MSYFSLRANFADKICLNKLVLRVLTVVSCVTFRIGFFSLALQFFGIALSRPKYVVKGT